MQISPRCNRELRSLLNRQAQRSRHCLSDDSYRPSAIGHRLGTSALKSSRCFVAGHRGLVGSAVVRALDAAGYPAPIVRTRDELDLLDQVAVREFFSKTRPQIVFLAAAKVGGIQANNTQRWDFLYQNLVLEANVLGSALEYGVEKLVFFGSSCIYPRNAPQPIREEYLLTGSLEETNEPYAIAKIAGLKLVEAANAQRGRAWV